MKYWGKSVKMYEICMEVGEHVWHSNEYIYIYIYIYMKFHDICIYMEVCEYVCNINENL